MHFQADAEPSINSLFNYAIKIQADNSIDLSLSLSLSLSRTLIGTIIGYYYR